MSHRTRLTDGSSSLFSVESLVPKARFAPFIACDTAAVVALGDKTPRGEVSGVSVPTAGATIGASNLMGGRFENSCAGDIDAVFVGVGAGVRIPEGTKLV